MKFGPKTKKIFKAVLVFDLFIEIVFFGWFGILYTKHNFRWDGKLIFEPQWVQDEDYIREIGLEAKIMQWMKEEQEEREREEMAKWVHEDDMPIPRRKHANK